MGKRILVVTGDGGESYETWYAIHRMLEEGHEPMLAAPSKRRLHLVIHDFELGWDTYVERQPGYGATADLALADARAGDFDAVLLIGGRAPEYLRHRADLLELVQTMASTGKWVFAICHGIQVLVTAELVKGRTVTCYEHVKSEVTRAGGEWSPRQAVRDGRLITAQTWESHPEFYRMVMTALREPE
jgi:protease I